MEAQYVGTEFLSICYMKLVLPNIKKPVALILDNFVVCYIFFTCFCLFV